MRVLVACESSGIVRDAFIAKGFDAVSCDLEDTEQPGPHYKGDILDILKLDPNWDLMIAHPPCTYLTNAGVRHLHSVPSRNGVITKVHGEERWAAMRKAADFFNKLLHAPIPYVAVENPVPHRYAREIIGGYQQLLQPWQFGHGETKATCLWLKGLLPLMSTNIVSGRKPVVHYMPPGPNRSKDRSRTYPGIAEAMADQWGRFITLMERYDGQTS